jgi:hypothetical protein
VSASVADLRRYHYDNYRAVQSALTHVERATKQAIRRNDAPTVRSLRQTQMLLVAIKAEARLMKLLFLPDGFSAVKRAEVLAESSVFDRWTTAVDIGYRSAFSIKRTADIRSALLHDDAARYDSLLRVLTQELEPIIAIRNKLAHGQWARPLNANRDDVDQNACKYVESEHALALILRDDALEGIANIIGDLMQSKRLYQSRFNTHFKRVQKLERWVVSGPSYKDWEAGLRASYARGQAKMKSNLSSEGEA